MDEYGSDARGGSFGTGLVLALAVAGMLGGGRKNAILALAIAHGM